MALQELDLTIQHWSGKHNANADALSQCPLLDSVNGVHAQSEGLVATLTAARDGKDDEPDRRGSLVSLQRGDPELLPLMDYLETGMLPSHDRDSRQVVLSSEQFTLEEGVLHHLEGDG